MMNFDAISAKFFVLYKSVAHFILYNTRADSKQTNYLSAIAYKNVRVGSKSSEKGEICVLF